MLKTFDYKGLVKNTPQNDIIIAIARAFPMNMNIPKTRALRLYAIWLYLPYLCRLSVMSSILTTLFQSFFHT